MALFLISTNQLAEHQINFAPPQAAVGKAKVDLDFFRLDEDSFSKSPAISFDYAIFEKSKSVSVVPSSFEWSDLGSWDSIWKMGEQDEHHNVGIGPITLNKTKNSLVLSENMRVAVSGLEDAVVILSEDAAYVGKLSDAQSVSDIVQLLQQDKARVYRFKNTTTVQSIGL